MRFFELTLCISLIIVSTTVHTLNSMEKPEESENNNALLFANINIYNETIPLVPAKEKTPCVIAHGLTGNPEHWQAYISDRDLAGIPGGWILDKNTKRITPRFDDCDEKGKFIPAHASIAQTSNITTLCKATPLAEHYFCIGVSRGGTAIITTFARATDDEAKLCKGAILESPPGNLTYIIKEHLKRYIWATPATFIATTLAPLSPLVIKEHKPNGIAADDLKVIKEVARKQIPLFFISSEEDNIVPAPCTNMIYYMLKKKGHKHCYLAALKKGKHANILISNTEEEAKHCVYAIHAFYKKYGIEPYNAEWARKGVLKNYRPKVPREPTWTEYFLSLMSEPSE